MGNIDFEENREKEKFDEIKNFGFDNEDDQLEDLN